VSGLRKKIAWIVLASAMLAGCVGQERSVSDGVAPARGEAVVAQWCADCHAIPGIRAPRDRPGEGPSFCEITERPGRDARYLAAFLREDHFPMTTYRLFEQERDDVVAYLLALRER
jgi:mono/diheme cytochrome c family protein